MATQTTNQTKQRAQRGPGRPIDPNSVRQIQRRVVEELQKAKLVTERDTSNMKGVVGRPAGH